MTRGGTIARDTHEALYQAAKAHFAGDAVRVQRFVGKIEAGSDYVSMGEFTAAQDPATMPRGRDELVQVTMFFTSHRGGDQEIADRDARDAAFDNLNSFAESLRVLTGDPTLDLTVDYCFLTTVQTQSATHPVGGMSWEIEATFEAMYRLRG